MSTVRTAVIGLGAIGSRHAQLYTATTGAELVAVADLDPRLLDRTAGELQVARRYHEAAELLADPEIDAVSVCVPNFLHADLTVAALEAGKHVLCEKPMATSVADAARMVEAAEAAGKQLMIGFHERFRPSARAVAEMIAAGAFGELYHAQIVYQRRRGIPGLGGWFTTRSKSGGGPIIDVGVHILDLTLHLMGYPAVETVSAATHSRFGSRSDYTYVNMWASESAVPGGTFDVEDYATALVRLRGGATINVECCWAANLEQRNYALLLGDQRGARLEGGQAQIIGEDHGYLADLGIHTRAEDPYANEIAHFVACARDNALPLPNGRQVLELQRLVDALYRSAAAGREVVLD